MSETASKAVFLSYASQDAEAAKRICEALRTAGVEVWFDQSELRGGDAWDQKIRRQIKECSLFVPVISAATQARGEGYFRLEWKLAVDRSHLMADDTPFLFPVVIDDTPDSTARVPDRFREVQWTRLNVKDTPETLAARVGKLLAKADDATDDEEEDRGERRRGRRRGGKPAWLRYTMSLAGVAIGLIYAIKGLWRPEHADSNAPAALPTPPALSPVSPSKEISEAQQLVAKARQLFTRLDGTRDDGKLAEEYLTQAISRDPTDAEVWAAMAQLHNYYIVRGWDISDKRREDSRGAAQRALRIAPQSFEARFTWYPFNGLSVRELEEGERTLRVLRAERPTDQRVLRTLATTVQLLGRRDEANVLRDESAGLPGGDPLALYDKGRSLWTSDRPIEAEAALQASLRQQPVSSALLLTLWITMDFHGELDQAKQILDQIPSAALVEDRGCYFAYTLYYYRREPDAALAALRAMPRDWIVDNWYRGPKGTLAGDAQRMAGRPEAAALEWRAALKLVETRLAANPSDLSALFNRAILLGRLGEREEGSRALALVEQMTTEWGKISVAAADRAAALVVVGRRSEALKLIARVVESERQMASLPSADLRLNPNWDSLRAEPEFARLIALADAKEKAGGLPAVGAPDAKSVAVLAFANLSEDRNNEYFSEGISEELLNVLAKIPTLKVSARTSAFYFKGKEVPIPEIARQLSVAYVVEGSVRRSGDRVRITAQLISAASGFHVWSDTFTRDLKDIFAVQDEIAGLIAKQLQVEMGMTPPESRHEVNPEAHRLVLEGRHYWNLRTEDGFARAEAAFMRAIEADPKFAQAHAGLADVLASRAIYLSYRGLESTTATRARTEAQRALALDPSLAEAYPALGAVCLFEGKLAEAEQQFQKAFALNPNYPLAHHWYALVLEVQGRLDVALKEINLAIQFDPLSVMALHTRGRLLNNVRRYTEALADFSQVQVLRPDMVAPTGARGMSLLGLGRNEEAVSAAKTVVASDEVELRLNADLEAVLVLDKTGHRQDAEQHVARLIPRLAEGSYVRGTVLAALSRWDEALPYLQHTPPTMKYIFYWHPAWDGWRDDARFQQLLVKLGCEKEYRVARETLARMLKENEAKK